MEQSFQLIHLCCRFHTDTFYNNIYQQMQQQGGQVPRDIMTQMFLSQLFIFILKNFRYIWNIKASQMCCLLSLK